MRRQTIDAVAEELQAKLALDAVRAGDRGERDFTLAAAAHGQPWVSSAAPSAASSPKSPVSPVASATGDPSVGGATSSAPSAGASADLPSVTSLLGGSFLGRSFAGVRSLGGAASSAAAPLRLSRFGRTLLVPQAPPGSLPRRLLAAALSAEALLAVSAGLLSGHFLGGGCSATSWRPLALGSRSRFNFLGYDGFGLCLGRRQLQRPRLPSRHAPRRAPWPFRPAPPSSGCCAPDAPECRRHRGSEDAVRRLGADVSQCEMRSASSFTRSGESFASSGL